MKKFISKIEDYLEIALSKEAISLIIFLQIINIVGCIIYFETKEGKIFELQLKVYELTKKNIQQIEKNIMLTKEVITLNDVIKTKNTEISFLNEILYNPILDKDNITCLK